MNNLEAISEELFNKIRGRFPSVTIGDSEGKVTNVPTEARFFDFDYMEGKTPLGKVSISIDDKSLAVMYSNDFVANEDSITKDNWYNFLRELRQFSKKRMLNFDTRNITKSNLDRRDYKFLATNRGGDGTMNESKMYGTSKVSYQNFGEARLMIKHTESIDQEAAGGRAKKVGALYIESAEGERFKYPYKHLSGARAMTRHVAEGGKPFDEFGKHITGLSEEMSKLRKFKTYMGRSAVMAESLSEYMDVVKDRINTVKKTIDSLQKPNSYKEAFESFEVPMMEDVPEDVAENWIDQLTIKQFNEELSDVFPYIYNLIKENTKAQELGPEDLEEANERTDEALPIILGLLGLAGAAYTGLKLTSARRTPLGRAVKIACDNGDESACEYFQNLDLYVDTNDTSTLQYIKRVYVTEPFGDFENIPESKYEDQIESSFDEMMGQFGEAVVDGEISVDAVKKNVLELLVDIAKTSKQYKGEVTDDQVYYLGSLVQDFDMAGIETEKYSEIEKLFRTMSKTNKADMTMIQPAYAQAKGLDEDANNNGIEAAVEEQKTPLGEFILSYFDYTSGQFPKGETAILTMVEKDYGEQYIDPAKQFIEKINNRVSEVMGYREEEPVVQDNTELDSIRSLAGL